MILPAGSDTCKPASLSPMSFLRWKCDLQSIGSTVVEAVFMTAQRSYQGMYVARHPSASLIVCITGILKADRDLRAFDAKLPEHLRCRSAPLWRVASDIPDDHFRTSQSSHVLVTGLGDEGMPLVLRLQQIRLGILYNHALRKSHGPNLSCQRPCMALQYAFIGPHSPPRCTGDPLQGPFAPRVLAVVVETSSNLINLVWALYRIELKNVCWVVSDTTTHLSICALTTCSNSPT